MDIRQKAEQMNKLFIKKQRDNGESYICIEGLAGQDYPQWMQDVIFAGHLDTMPNDESYKAIRDIISSITELDEDTEWEAASEVIEALRNNNSIEPDCYTSNLTGWLHSNNGYVYYLTEAISEYGCTDGFQALTMAQQIWLEEVAQAIADALENAES